MMGPCFSGTLAMLWRSIKTQDVFGTRKVTLYSGTASAEGPWERFKYQIKDYQPGVQSATFLRTNKNTMGAVTDFLGTNLGWSENLASLSEEGTVFGDDFRAANKDSVEVRATKKGPVEFRFPRGLSARPSGLSERSCL